RRRPRPGPRPGPSWVRPHLLLQPLDGPPPEHAGGVGGAVQPAGDLLERQPLPLPPADHLPVVLRQPPQRPLHRAGHLLAHGGSPGPATSWRTAAALGVDTGAGPTGVAAGSSACSRATWRFSVPR